MKGDKILFILEQVEDGVEDMADLFFAFLNAGYGASSRKIEYERDRLATKRIDRKMEAEAKKKFKSLLQYLCKQGLVNKKENGIFKLTQRGRKRAREIKERKKTKSLPRANYPIKKHSAVVIVAFDIPEKERHKRNWVRLVLVNLNFKPVQKSLFVGRTKIPEEFLEDLRDLGIIENVAIFEVDRGVTLDKIKF